MMYIVTKKPGLSQARVFFSPKIKRCKVLSGHAETVVQGCKVLSARASGGKCQYATFTR
jgi:hypothetical protein